MGGFQRRVASLFGRGVMCLGPMKKYHCHGGRCGNREGCMPRFM